MRKSFGLIALLTVAASPPQPVNRTYEGDWYVSDSTDNNTGEREVYAFQIHLKRDDPNFVTLTMRCAKGKPTFFVEWQDQTFPDQAVLTIRPIPNPKTIPSDEQFVFEKSDEGIERGLRASPETSAKIIASIGDAKFLSMSAYLSAGTRTVEIDVAGTQGAWNRISRHCPVRTVPLPPI